MRGRELSERLGGVDRGTLGRSDGACLGDSPCELRPQLGIGEDRPDLDVVGAGDARKRVETDELAPHDERLGVEHPRGHASVLERTGEAEGAIGGGRRASEVDPQKRAGVDDDPGLRAIGLDADRASEHGIGREPASQHLEMVEPVEQRQHERRLDADALERLLEPGRLRGDDEGVDGDVEGACDRDPRNELPETHAAEMQPVALYEARSRVACDHAHAGAGLVQRCGEQAADPAGAEDRDLDFAGIGRGLNSRVAHAGECSSPVSAGSGRDAAVRAAFVGSAASTGSAAPARAATPPAAPRSSLLAMSVGERKADGGAAEDPGEVGGGRNGGRQQQPEILARGPWPLEQVTASWREEHFQPSGANAKAADNAIASLRERGSPSHDGMAARLVDFRSTADGLELELQPLRWALRLVEGDASHSVAALCLVRSADGRWLAGRRAPWLSSWAGRWALGAGGAVDLGENPARTLVRELEEEWSVAPERVRGEALVRLPQGMVMFVGQAWLPGDAEVTPDDEHDAHAWWPREVDGWPPEATEPLRRMALWLGE